MKVCSAFQNSAYKALSFSVTSASFALGRKCTRPLRPQWWNLWTRKKIPHPVRKAMMYTQRYQTANTTKVERPTKVQKPVQLAFKSENLLSGERKRARH